MIVTGSSENYQNSRLVCPTCRDLKESNSLSQKKMIMIEALFDDYVRYLSFTNESCILRNNFINLKIK